MKTIITRKSRNLGFGYTTGFDGNKALMPDYQDHTGTVRTILRDLERDINYECLQDGTIYAEAWFVKLDGIWYRVKQDSEYKPSDLLKSKTQKDFFHDSIVVELEKDDNFK